MSSSVSSLSQEILQRIDGRDDPPARLEANLRARLKELARQVETDPFANPKLLAALDVAGQLERERLTIADLEGLVRRLSLRCVIERSRRQRAYLGVSSPATVERAFRAFLDELAGTERFEQVRERLSTPLFGIVLTAHPTFGMSQAMAAAIAALAEEDAGEPDEVERGLTALIEAGGVMPPDSLDLSVEHEWSLHVLTHLATALDRLNHITLDWAFARYGRRAVAFEPSLVTVATWVGYDLDGRADIGWDVTIAKRLRVKQTQLERIRRELAPLAADQPDLRSATALLDAAVPAIERQIRAAEAFNHGFDIAQLSQAFVDTRTAALTTTVDLRRLIDRAIASTTDDARALSLARLRAGLASHGLSLACTHVRLNATQLHNAIRRQVGMDAAPTDPAYRRRYVTAINDLLQRVRAETVNFANLEAEAASAKRLFMIVQQIVKYIDAETPIRFLIAETEAGFTLLTALYFARLFGVEHQVEISPLFETAAAIERGDAILEEALRSEVFRDYVRAQGRLCVQFGFSDSGRYLGQMAATFQIERLRLRIASLLERHSLTDIQLVLFNTHGESIGRGGHPESLRARLDYVAPPRSRQRFAEAGIRVKEEDSFQGGDGFGLLMSVSAAFTVMVEALRCYAPARPATEDPIYAAGDYAVEFFALVRQGFGALAADPDYLNLLGAFGTNLAPRSGSRPVQRQSEGVIAGPRYESVAQLRAIPNNACLQQLAFLANTIHGVGLARAQDPELFDHMRAGSPRFEAAMAMVDAACRRSDPDLLKAYIDLLDPGSWLARSAHVRNRVRAAELRAVSAQLERLDLHPSLSRLYRRLQRDFLLLAQGPERAMPPDGTLALLHVLRIALMLRVFVMATRVPTFSPQRGVTSDDLMAGILRLEVRPVVARLKEIFPKSITRSADVALAGEPSTYHGDTSQGYAREHAQLFEPMLQMVGLVERLGNLISLEVGAVG